MPAAVCDCKCRCSMNKSMLTPPDVSVSKPRRVVAPASSGAPTMRKVTPVRRAARGADWKGTILLIGGIVILSGGLLFLIAQMRGGKSLGRWMGPVDIESMR